MKPTKLSLIDLHCDTIYELYRQEKDFGDTTVAIDFSLGPYQKYLQTTAIWCDKNLTDDEAYTQFLRIVSHLGQTLEARYSADMLITKNFRGLTEHPSPALLLAVEDARLLNRDLTRLDVLYNCGVRILTLAWQGNSCICGAYDTTDGLTGFGKEVLHRCVKLGIIPDLSHASDRTAQEALELTENSPLIASHSDSRTVFPHPRNLSDELFCEIRRRGGLVGINLYTEHLGYVSGDPVAVVLRHIEHFLSLGGEDTLCFGCDFDGAKTPPLLQHPQDLTAIAEEMAKIGYPDRIIHKLFWKNAERFLSAYI